MPIKNVTSDDLKFLLTLLPVLDNELSEVRETINKERGQVFAPDSLNGYWCQFYEMPFAEHAQRVLASLGLESFLVELQSAPNQFTKLKELLSNADQEEEILSADELDAARKFLFPLFGMTYSLHNSLRCLMTFGCYLNELIERVRTRAPNSDKALFNAVKIDPTVVGCHSVLTRISQAVLVDDKQFLRGLQLALSGKLTKREQANYAKMRLVLQVLSESGITHLSDNELYDLFVQSLDLYAPDSRDDKGDVKKNLRKFANQYMRKSKSTT